MPHLFITWESTLSHSHKYPKGGSELKDFDKIQMSKKIFLRLKKRKTKFRLRFIFLLKYKHKAYLFNTLTSILQYLNNIFGSL